jgi:uncharacterized membrane protein YqhA
MREEQTDRAGHDTGPDAALAEPAARGDGNAAGAPPPGRALDRLEDGFERFLVLARLLVLVPVIILVLAAAAAFVYATVVFAVSIPGIIEHPLPPGPKLALFVLEIDVFLIGATLIIAAFGFYELFISKIDPARGQLRLPGWLKIRDLNDLKARVASMLILVAAVTFVKVILEGRFGVNTLYLGAAVALVVAALTAFLRFGSRERGGA